MSFGSKQSSYEAVLYVNRKKVLKEMLYSEFEALLDGIVSETEFKDETCHAVYLKIDMQLNIRAAVFFCIDFDKEGIADRRWNLPLAQMAESSSVALQFNGQGVRISCRSRCRIAAQQEKLWEPDLGPGSEMLSIIASCIRKNRLGLLVEEGATDASQPAANPAHVEESARQAASASNGADYSNTVTSEKLHAGEVRRLTDNLQKQRLYIASLKGRQEEALQNLRAQFAREKEALLLQLEESCSTLKAVQARNQELQGELREAHQQAVEQGEHFEKQLSASKNQQGVDFTDLRKQFRRELQQKLIEQTSELKAKLDMRDVEAHYRDEQIKHLKEQLKQGASLAASQSVNGAGSDNGGSLRSAVIELEERGVNFVLTLPAVRPITIPAADVDAFCQDPDAFVASRLGLEPGIFVAWKAHATNPVCVERITDECCCGARLEIVHPRDFVPDCSDRCRDHRDQPTLSKRAGA